MISAPSATIATPAQLEVPDAEMIVRYNQAGPRYTSYPPAPYWSGEYGPADYRAALAEAGLYAAAGDHAFSVYMHLPFCERRCTFCACNVVISRDHSRAGAYIDQLTREMDLALLAMSALPAPPTAASSGRCRPRQASTQVSVPRPRITQMHWGGGTPTWLTASELGELCSRIAERFELLPDREQSIEIDPRVTTPDQLDVLRSHGLTRISMGVQDFDARVQRAVNRVQSRKQTEAIIHHARSIGIKGVNVDLIYGLPHQAVDAFARTVDAVIALGVDRVALYNFAWLPTALKHHKAIRPETLPSAEVRIELFRMAAARFAEAGYIMIGLDHFARATDELATAMQDDSLQRNFMGYTTRGGDAACGLLSFGASSISRIGRDFAQNVKTTSAYRMMLESGSLPVDRGLRLSDEDLAREHIIQRLMCYGRIDFDQVQARFGLDPLTGEAIERLDALAADGLLSLDVGPGAGSRDTVSGVSSRPARRKRTLTVLPLGRYFLRNIAMVFDAYLGQPPKPQPDQSVVQVRFSRTV